MEKKIGWLLLSLLVVTAMVLASCGGGTETTTTGEATTITGTITTTTTGTTTTTPTTPTTPTTKAEEPKYGGELTLALPGWINSFLPDAAGSGVAYTLGLFEETIGMGDLTKGPTGTNEFPFTTEGYVPPTCRTGALATSWEMTDPQTLIVYLRKGVRFQNIPPVNGREMVANDMVTSWLYFKASKTHDNDWVRNYLDTVTAVDTYKVKVTFTKPVADIISKFMTHRAAAILPAEMLTTYKDKLGDFHYAIGTGPFIVTDFVPDSAFLYMRNPDYWGYDPLHPQNRLPYVDRVTMMCIQDSSTLLAALRTGRVDRIYDVSARIAMDLKKTNPDLLSSYGLGRSNQCKVSARFDYKPFDDIRVRKAMLMATDFDTIIKSWGLGYGVKLCWPYSPSWTDVYTPLEQCPADIQEMYTYDPVKAKALLTAAGYADGFTTEVVITQPVVERMQILTGYWEQNLNIKTVFNVVDTNTWIGAVYGRKYTQMCAGGAGQTDPVAQMAFYTSDAFYNYEVYKNPEYDKLYNEMSTASDTALYTQRAKDLNIWFIRNRVPLAFPLEYIWTFWQPWVKNYGGEIFAGYGWIGPIAARIWINKSSK